MNTVTITVNYVLNIPPDCKRNYVRGIFLKLA